MRAHPGHHGVHERRADGQGGQLRQLPGDVAVHGERSRPSRVEVGSIVVATGFDTYEPAAGEFGYGIDGVVTLPEFKRMVDASAGPLQYNGRPVQDVAYIYCVGSRQGESVEGGHTYCSRYCCTAAVHAALEAPARATRRPAPVPPLPRHAHLRQVRAAVGGVAREGLALPRVPDDEPPEVERLATGGLKVTVSDLLTGGAEVAIPVDLVVLVTGMVPRENDELVASLKLPVGSDGFFNEIHPKLRPVETVVDGVSICGACQSPKNSAESVACGLAAVTQSGAMLKHGFAELDPLVATVDAEACTWCGKCAASLPLRRRRADRGRTAGPSPRSSRPPARAAAAACRSVPPSAIDLQGYTDAQIKAMIDGLLGVGCA